MRPGSHNRPLAAEIASLSDLPRAALLARWKDLHGAGPPKYITQDFLIRALATSLQERALGGLARSERKALTALAEGREHPGRKVLKAGTRLYREWRGVSHEVLITDDGCRWREKDFQSLSQVARAITGTRWSGPRFFGLTT